MTASWIPRAALLASALTLAGCASLAPDQAVAPVQSQSLEWLKADLPWQRDDARRDEARQRSAALLAQPVDAHGAVQLALLNHRGLQATLYGLGMAESDRVQTLLWPNPALSIGRMVRGEEREIERGLSLNLIQLLGRGARQQAGARALEREQSRAAQQLLDVAAQARRRWIEAVASQEQLTHARTVVDSASAGAELATRMRQAGNISALRLARERAVLVEAQLSLAQAELQSARDREALVSAMGLWGDDAAALRLPERLPDVPDQPRDDADLERQAIAQRLDIQAAKRQAELQAADLGLTRQTGRINVLALELQRNSSNQEGPQRGVGLSLELPLFDWGQARVTRAQQAYMQSVELTAQAAIEARAEVRSAQARADHAWRAARRHREELVPLARQISDETLLRYNGMLAGVMELLADARAQARAVSASLAAQRDYWLAEADLSQSLFGPVRDTAAVSAGASSEVPAGAPAAAH